MRIAVVTGPGEVELRDAAAPTCGPRQVLVELGGCGLCTLDRRLFSGEQPLYPTWAGHEPAGRVVELGSAVEELPGAPAVGDLVIVDMRTRCGVCHACRRGRSAICLASQARPGPDGVKTIAGGLADVIAVDVAQAWSVGEVLIEHAAMGEPVACVAHSLRRGGFSAGDRVAVVGSGFMGRLHLAMTRALGAASVGMIDTSESRLSESEDAGADWTASPDGARRVGAEVDVVFVTAGAPGSLELALDLTAKGGSVVLYGAFPDDLAVGVHPNHMHHEETTITGVHSHEPEDWRTAAGLITSGALSRDLDGLVTARFGLADVFDAFKLVSSQPTLRVIVGG